MAGKWKERRAKSSKERIHTERATDGGRGEEDEAKTRTSRLGVKGSNGGPSLPNCGRCRDEGAGTEL